MSYHCVKFLIIFFFSSVTNCFAQKLVAGPFQGATNPGEMNIWLMVKKQGEVKLTLINKTTHERRSLTQATEKGTYRKYFPLIFHFKNLDKSGIYSWEYITEKDSIIGETELIIVDDSIIDFSFLIGSCVVRIPRPFTLLHPGIEDKIFDAMRGKECEFMLWLGDNLYYKSKQMADSYESMETQYIKQRKISRINKFLKGQANYAIWDDHDYGTNDSNRDFKYKEFTLEAFKNYWPNPSYGLTEAPGVFFHFVKRDVEIFMTDDRYHRSNKDDKDATFFGTIQKEWLKSKLLASKATFKFIATGNQVFSPVNKGESFQDFKTELNELVNFIGENQISGVIFLSGDRHHTELMKVNDKIDYPIYEFTNSALTSIGIRPKNSTEKTNPIRIDNTMVFDNNFGRISILGPLGDRSCKLETFSNTGDLLWEYFIPQSELSFN